MLFKHTLVRFHQEEIWKKNHDSNYLDVILRYFEDLKKSVINTKIQNERDKRWRWMNFEDACKMKCEALIKFWMFFFSGDCFGYGVLFDEWKWDMNHTNT